MASTETETDSPKLENNFNLLRLLFALSVILAHSPEMVDGNRSREPLTQIFHTTSFGQVAVNGFFLLSGYLIIQSWESKPEIFAFLKKRVLRIYPAFILAALISGLIVGPLGANPATYFSQFWVRGFGTSILMLTIPATPPTFVGSHHAGVNGPMWTVHYEFMCYLTVLLFGAIGLLKRKGLFSVIAIAAVLVFATKNLGYLTVFGVTTDELSWPPIRFYSFFFVGGLFYLFRSQIPLKGGFAVLAAIAMFFGMFNSALAELSIAVFGSYLLFYFAFVPSTLLAHFRKLPDASYGLYLYAWPIGKLLTWYVPSISPWELVGLTAAIAYTCGLLSWYLIEKPFLSLKNFRWPSSKTKLGSI